MTAGAALTRHDPNPSRRDLEGRHALVTGGSGGLGAACALNLTKRGALVTLVARRRETLERVASDIRSNGGLVELAECDVTDSAAVSAVVNAADANSPLWICVNGAGVNKPGAVLTYAVEDFEALFAVNVRGTFLVCQAVGRRMIEHQRGGRIVNMSSQMGSVGYPGRSAYCATKHAVNGMTKVLALEWAKDSITVNAVAPTFIDTPMTHHMFDNPAFKDDILGRIPMGRLGTADEVAAAVGFLASSEASLITGHILNVDGGWTVW